MGLAWHRAARSALSTAALQGLQDHHPTGESLQQLLVQCRVLGAVRRWEAATACGARRSPGEVLGNAVAFCPVPKASLPPRVLACPAALSAPCLSHCLHHCLPRCAVCPTAVASTAFACPTGPRELAHPGSPDAGRAAVCIAGHHPVHGLLGHGELRCGRAGQRPLSGLVLG